MQNLVYFKGMRIKKAELKDCARVADIHIEQIKTGFLSSLGKKFLKYFYSSMVDSDNAFLLVASDDNISGFISGVVDLNKFYSEFVRKYFFVSLPIIFKKLLSLKKIIETMRYAKKESDLPGAELLTLAVLDSLKGQGVATKLLAAFNQEMKRRGVAEYKVLAGTELLRANGFYLKNGFVLHHRESIHKGKTSNVYLYKIL